MGAAPRGRWRDPRHGPRRPGAPAPRRDSPPPQRHAHPGRHDGSPRNPDHHADPHLIDLATTLNGRPLEHALDLAEQRGLVDFAELRKAIEAHPTRPGSPSLQARCPATPPDTVTRSELEERFLALCDDHGLPRPNVNTRIEGTEVDFVWRDGRLIVEVDGYAYHRSPSAFEDDRARDVALTVAGWAVLRFTWAQITSRPRWVAAAIRRRLAS